jgi:hypothetical protein
MGSSMKMRCENCDKEVTHAREHCEERSSTSNFQVRVVTTWSCEGIDWRKRALEAEERCKMLEERIHNLWSTTNA